MLMNCTAQRYGSGRGVCLARRTPQVDDNAPVVGRVGVAEGNKLPQVERQYIYGCIFMANEYG